MSTGAYDLAQRALLVLLYGVPLCMFFMVGLFRRRHKEIATADDLAALRRLSRTLNLGLFAYWVVVFSGCITDLLRQWRPCGWWDVHFFVSVVLFFGVILLEGKTRARIPVRGPYLQEEYERFFKKGSPHIARFISDYSRPLGETSLAMKLLAAVIVIPFLLSLVAIFLLLLLLRVSSTP